MPVVRTIYYWTKVVVQGGFRRKQLSLNQEFREFRRQYGTLFSRTFYPTSRGKRVLIVGAGMPGTIVELALIKAFELAGYQPIIITEYDRWAQKYYRLAGVEHFLFWETFRRPVAADLVENALNSIQSFEHLIKLDFAGARVGKYAASTALRYLRLGHLDLRLEPVRRVFFPYLQSAMEYAAAAKEMVQTVKPDLALSIDPGYTPRGELFDLCLASGVATITWNAAHKNNMLMLKRYTLQNRDVHPASLSEGTWKQLCQLKWGQNHRDRLQQELKGSYMSGEWYSEVGTQFHTRLHDRNELLVQLGLHLDKKTAIIFPHIFWDGTFFWGTDLFSSYEEWFLETIRVACLNKDVNWVIKVHPANTVKNIRDGVQSEPSEVVAIHQQVGTLPPHISVIPADSSISTLSLFEVMDYCITVRGTIGIEAASYGIPVLTAGTGRYDHFGFTIDSESKGQYLERLAHIQHIPPLSPDQRDLAERFAYGVFVQRPFPLRTVTLEYRKDAKASLATKVTVPSTADLRHAQDLSEMARWIQSKSEDFLSC